MGVEIPQKFQNRPRRAQPQQKRNRCQCRRKGRVSRSIPKGVSQNPLASRGRVFLM